MGCDIFVGANWAGSTVIVGGRTGYGAVEHLLPGLLHLLWGPADAVLALGGKPDSDVLLGVWKLPSARTALPGSEVGNLLKELIMVALVSRAELYLVVFSGTGTLGTRLIFGGSWTEGMSVS